MSPRRYAILGTGALGGYFGARLHHAGADVHFLLHRDYDHVAANGLKVESRDGDFSIATPSIYRRAADLPACDIVMVCLKSTANAALPDLLRDAVRPGAAVLVMQNGLGVERQAAEALGDRLAGVAVWGGMAFLCSQKVGPGHVRHFDYGSIRLGAYREDDEPGGVPDAMRSVADQMIAAGIPVEVEADLVLARWKKLVWNVPYNGLTVVLDTTTDRLMGYPPTRELCHLLMDEVAAAARGRGRRIDPAFIRKMLADTDKMVSYEPSMKVDYNHGRELEVEAIYGSPVRAAEAAGVAVPCMRSLYQQLSFVNHRLAEARGDQ